MVVTRLELELCFQGRKLRGVTWKLTRSEHGFLPESSWRIAAQVLVPYLVSGLGMVSAGIVMDLIQVRDILSRYIYIYSYIYSYIYIYIVIICLVLG